MIKKEGSQYKVYSEDGSKHLGSYSTKAAAQKRLRQIEYFKNKDKPKKRIPHPSKKAADV